MITRVEYITPAEQVKSLNRRWKEDGKTIPFKDYAERYNKKNATGNNADIQVPVTTEMPGMNIIPTWALAGAGVLIAGAVIYAIVKT